MISIAIPTYEMKPHGAKFLNFSLEKIYKQTYNNIEIVISDHSNNNIIYDICDSWVKKLNIKYVKNSYNIGSSSYNLNNAVKNCTNDYVKILFQDDFLYNNNNSVQNIIDVIKNKNPIWIATASEHSSDGVKCYRKFIPKYNNKIWLGINTISSPSVITFKKSNFIEFDNTLIWLMDCDWYKKMYDVYGPPSHH